MAPSTPERSSSTQSTPFSTPSGHYPMTFNHPEGTDTFHVDAKPDNTQFPQSSRSSSSSSRDTEVPDNRQSASSSPSFPSASGSGSTSFNDDSMLEILDNDEDEMEVEEDALFDEEEGEGEEGDMSAGQPLVSRGRNGRRRKRWDQNEMKVKERSLVELIPPLILSHPLPLLPLLALLPYNFLPAGVVVFVPLFCGLALLSSCAHVVIVYLAWYLKVNSFEEVFACVAGRYGRWAGRSIVVCSVMGLVVGWLGTLHPLIAPAIESYLPNNGFYSSRILWTILGSTSLLPSLLPSRITRPLRKSPIVLALLLPVVAFLVIGRTVEIKKAADLIKDDESSVEFLSSGSEMVGRAIKRSLGGSVSAGAGITTLTLFLTPHLNTLPIHSSLTRNSRSQFPIPCLATSTFILILSLPLALVPYYLLPIPQNIQVFTDITLSPTSTSTGVFSLLPADDGWVNFARFLTCAITLGTCNMWILRGRDTMLKVLGVERGDGRKAARWVGVGMWVIAVFFACFGGKLVEKIELVGVVCALAAGWFLPSLFFIITFHVRSPLAIVFPYSTPAAPIEPPTPVRSLRSTQSLSHSRTDSLNDPSTDHLLARKERQLQKRRAGRRLWQDLIVYLGILPVGTGCLVWTLGRLIGVW